MKIKQKCLSLLLALTMVTGTAFSTTAFAADEGAETEPAETTAGFSLKEPVPPIITEEPAAEDGGTVTDFDKTGRNPIEVSLTTESEISGVRVEVEVTKDDEETDGLQLIAEDTKEEKTTWYNIVKAGWGPAEGFSLNKNETKFTPVYLVASEAGTYDVTIRLVDASDSGSVRAEKTVSVTAVKPDITNEDDLKEAIKEAGDNDTITLGGNFDVSSSIVIDKQLTLDGNGHTITASDDIQADASSGKNHVIAIVNTEDVKIENLNIAGNKKTGVDWEKNARSGILVYASTGVNLTDISVSDATCGIILDESTLTLNGNAEFNGNTWGGINITNSSPDLGEKKPQLLFGEDVSFSGDFGETPQIWADCLQKDEDALAEAKDYFAAEDYGWSAEYKASPEGNGSQVWFTQAGEEPGGDSLKIGVENSTGAVGDFYTLLFQNGTAQLNIQNEGSIAPTWTSEDEEIATVDSSSGKVTAVGPGLTKITASAAGYQDGQIFIAVCSKEQANGTYSQSGSDATDIADLKFDGDSWMATTTEGETEYTNVAAVFAGQIGQVDRTKDLVVQLPKNDSAFSGEGVSVTGIAHKEKCSVEGPIDLTDGVKIENNAVSITIPASILSACDQIDISLPTETRFHFEWKLTLPENQPGYDLARVLSVGKYKFDDPTAEVSEFENIESIEVKPDGSVLYHQNGHELVAHDVVYQVSSFLSDQYISEFSSEELYFLYNRDDKTWENGYWLPDGTTARYSLVTEEPDNDNDDNDHDTNSGGSGSGSSGRGGHTVIVSGAAPDNKPVVTVGNDPQGKPVVTVGARPLPNAKPLTAAEIAKKAADGTLNAAVNPNGVWDGRTVGAKNIALVIDTKEAALATGGSYRLGVSAFAGPAGSKLRVRASRDGFVTITTNPDGTYTITANRPVSGLYILVEILDANGNVVGHSSMKLDAAAGLASKQVQNKAATIA